MTFCLVICKQRDRDDISIFSRPEISEDSDTNITHIFLSPLAPLLARDGCLLATAIRSVTLHLCTAFTLHALTSFVSRMSFAQGVFFLREGERQKKQSYVFRPRAPPARLHENYCLGIALRSIAHSRESLCRFVKQLYIGTSICDLTPAAQERSAHLQRFRPLCGPHCATARRCPSGVPFFLPRRLKNSVFHSWGCTESPGASPSQSLWRLQ